MAKALLAMVLAGLLGFATGQTAAAQVATVLHGRVEDALTREPLENVRLFAADSSSAVLTDSLGVFALPLGPDVPFAILAERLGYFSQRFDLPPEGNTRQSVLLLEPMAIALQGITVEEESALTTLVGGLESRRNAFNGPVFAYDRERLDIFAPFGNVLDFVRRRNAWIRECDGSFGQLCVPGRARTISNPNPQGRVSVCIDGFRALAPASDLALMDIGSVSLVEFYGRQHVRVYSAEYLLTLARRGDTNVLPLSFGC